MHKYVIWAADAALVRSRPASTLTDAHRIDFFIASPSTRTSMCPCTAARDRRNVEQAPSGQATRMAIRADALSRLKLSTATASSGRGETLPRSNRLDSCRLVSPNQRRLLKLDGPTRPKISAGILAVPLPWSLSLFRPVTLRRHLSVALPLTESRPELLLIARRRQVTRFTALPCRLRMAATFCEVVSRQLLFMRATRRSGFTGRSRVPFGRVRRLVSPPEHFRFDGQVVGARLSLPGIQDLLPRDLEPLLDESRILEVGEI